MIIPKALDAQCQPQRRLIHQIHCLLEIVASSSAFNLATRSEHGQLILIIELARSPWRTKREQKRYCSLEIRDQTRLLSASKIWHRQTRRSVTGHYTVRVIGLRNELWRLQLMLLPFLLVANPWRPNPGRSPIHTRRGGECRWWEWNIEPKREWYCWHERSPDGWNHQ